MDYADLFGKRSKGAMTESLNELVALGFLIRKDKKLYEGPLLDSLIDYTEMVEHIQAGLLEQLPSIMQSQSLRTENNLNDEV